MDIETIYGEVVAKANHYQAVPDKGGGRRIIKDDAIVEYALTTQQMRLFWKPQQE